MRPRSTPSLPPSTSELFEHVRHRQEQVEAAYGRPLFWEALPAREACRIADYKDGCSVAEEEPYNEFIDWFRDETPVMWTRSSRAHKPNRPLLANLDLARRGIDPRRFRSFTWNGTSDLVSLPTATLVARAGRAPSLAGVDAAGARAAESRHFRSRAATFDHASELRLRLDIARAYSGTLHLYTLRWERPAGGTDR